jgi:hypothetical protein
MGWNLAAIGPPCVRSTGFTLVVALQSMLSLKWTLSRLLLTRTSFNLLTLFSVRTVPFGQMM